VGKKHVFASEGTVAVMGWQILAFCALDFSSLHVSIYNKVV
jgi:hypothetical protein